ncbi:unnamed protein product [Linum trigynum]|uniref:Uncharacterized protein n=1 Tax=Linum trigynum TaxID=586398 RepID=A0AAV2ECR0_9ROSI
MAHGLSSSFYYQLDSITSGLDMSIEARPKPNPPVLTLDDPNNTRATSVEKYKNLPKLPLIKANAVGVWHVDAAELEVKVLGEANKKVKVKMSVEEWKMFVEKKREVGERLMWQYAQDYEQSRGQNADIKMLVTTQRSGTAADKVSAFSVLIGDNPMANLRSLDALVGMVASKVGKRHALSGFEALKELFVERLPLRSFWVSFFSISMLYAVALVFLLFKVSTCCS